VRFLDDSVRTRDFIYVKEIVAALEVVNLTLGLTGVFNAGYGDQITILELAQRILCLAGSHPRYGLSSHETGDVHNSRARVERLQNADFRSTGTLDGGLGKCCLCSAPNETTDSSSPLQRQWNFLSKSPLLCDRKKAALEAITEAEAWVGRSEERWWCAELYRLRGVFLAAMGADEAQTEASLYAAIRTAREQRSASLAARAEATHAEYRSRKRER
jgi:hypothetical protein